MKNESAPMSLPQGLAGEIIIRSLANGTIVLEGWVGSLDGHRHALDSARQAFGARIVNDRVTIVLGARDRAEVDGDASQRGYPIA